MLANTIRKLWNDEGGFVVSADLILISTILVIGVLVGLVTLRDQVVQEFGDLATAVGNLNQSYSFAGSTVTFTDRKGTSDTGDDEDLTFTVAGSSFADKTDLGETGTDEGSNTDPPNAAPAGIDLSVLVTAGEG
ncbi:MAG TPA: hypothetical protein PLF81_20165 [Candidatus Anammoximicrobium sp.]|nr:hypothetical protein [Candidatus Anammoximicrobium sp.]